MLVLRPMIAMGSAPASGRRIGWSTVEGRRMLSVMRGEVFFVVGCMALQVAGSAPSSADGPDAVLPPGVEAVWDLAKAYRETTPTRDRVSLNGLWRWQPAAPATDAVPADGWGYFKVPGCWPGITSYMQKDCQTVFTHPRWSETRLAGVTAAWYQREIELPAGWAGRRVTVAAEYVNSYAVVFVNGAKVGEIRFPGGEVDLSGHGHPGRKYQLSLLVVALPLKGVMLSYSDSASARQVKGVVERRGLCGDVFLEAAPAGARLRGVKIDPSVRARELRIEVAMEGFARNESYAVAAEVWDRGRKVHAFRSPVFGSADLERGRFGFKTSWLPDRLWDIHTPEHQYDLRLVLEDAAERVVDVWPATRFGFREFWIEGRDFFLNGSRVFLSAVPLDNAQVGAAAASYAGARESLERLRRFGINFVYTHNYDCTPGAHLSFGEILRAADDVGMLVALTQPHFSHYDWASSEAEATNGYAAHAAFYVGVAQNHPSVVFYATSHNATGYNEDMNPDLMDGRYETRDTWSANNVKKALRAEAIIRSLDSTRVIYHHSSGNLGTMHTSNFYPNFVPVQELSDWFEAWSRRGTKPLFLCEHGAPFTWDWAMYRGWYQGKREFGSAVVPWEFCLAEWNAQFCGDAAFRISEMERRNLRWEARQFRDGRVWHRWDYPHQLGSADFPEREPILAQYYTDAWRAARSWGVSATSPWEHHILYRMRPGLDRNRRVARPVDWANLQQPGFSPDYEEERYERMDLAYGRDDWVPTAGALALERNNRPLLAYLAGKPGRFTSKDHLFTPGETLEKQVLVLNHSRVPVRAEVVWSLNVVPPSSGQTRLDLEIGEQRGAPVRVTLPKETEPGSYELSARVEFSTGERQTDRFPVHVVPATAAGKANLRVALFDPKGDTARMLGGLGVRFDQVEANTGLRGYEVLVVGRSALSVDGAVPDLKGVSEGLKVLVFEQTSEALERRLGFRVAEYGLRRVYPRVPGHPVVHGFQAEHLSDWRGEATLLPARLQYTTSEKFNGAPTVTWCGLPVTRVWRCGCQGNVASVLIEKPSRGDFLPLMDGGYSLQYSPLLEYREGRGLVIFCQLDVTGRTEPDPVAATLVSRLIEYVSGWRPRAERSLVYAGAPAGRVHLEATGIQVGSYDGSGLAADQVLLVGTGLSETQRPARAVVETFLRGGGRLLAVGLGQKEVDALLPVPVTLTPGEHVSACFDPPSAESWFAGIGPADVHCRDPRVLPLVTGGSELVGDGVLARSTNAPVGFCQLAPWEYDYTRNYGLKRTFRRTSFLLNRLLANLGVSGKTPLLERWRRPVEPSAPGRWLHGFYLDQPEEWDDPYRFFRW